MTKRYTLQGIIILIATAVLFTLHFAHTEFIVIRPDVDTPASYKEFLLRNTSGPRLIIDSGSNAYHGVHAKRIEEETGIPAINLGDLIGFPVDGKTARLVKHVGEGDVVLTMFEWQHYITEELHIVFMNGLPYPLSHYYRNFTLTERMHYVLQQTLGNLISAYRVPFRDKWTETDFMIENLQDYQAKFRNEPNGDHPFGKKQKRLFGDQACQDYVFAHGMDGLSSFFMNALDDLKRMKDKGAVVIASWPSVVGDDCYPDTPEFHAMVDRIKQAYAAYDIPILGKPEDHFYDARYYGNTYYHLNEEGRALRTGWMIDALTPYLNQLDKSKARSVRNSVAGAIERLDERFLMNKAEHLHYFTRDRLVPRPSEQELVLGQGWSVWEKTGIWTQGNVSKLAIKVDANAINPILLYVNGHYFQGRRGTHLKVNGQDFGSLNLDDGQAIKVPADLFRKNKGVIALTFRHPQATSPKALGINNDGRELGFMLSGLTLVYE